MTVPRKISLVRIERFAS